MIEMNRIYNEDCLEGMKMQDRLTKRIKGCADLGWEGGAYLEGHKLSKHCGDFPCKDVRSCSHMKDRTCMFLQALDQLAAYEDTGLTPDQIKSLSGALDEAVTAVHAAEAELDKYRSIGTVEELWALVEGNRDIDRIGSGAKGLIEEICKTPEFVEFMNLNLAALREKQEREKGCEYCQQGEEMAYGQDSMKRTAYIYLDKNLLVADLYSESMAVAVCYCPVCGKRLEVHHEAD